MKILLLDIETAPNLAYVWGLWQQNVGINQIESAGYVLCWAAKWLGEDTMMFDSVKKSGAPKMLARIHKLLDQADAVVHYNGVKFDIPTLNKEFIKAEMTPPAPYKHIDLLLHCRRMFRFESNKLDYVARALDLGKKVKHEGFELWLQCMAGDREAWKRMEEYNRHDVTLLEALYEKVRPWISGHPNRSVYGEGLVCPNCGHGRVQARGYAVSKAAKFKRYQCCGCGHWFRDAKRVPGLAVSYRQITD
jgi:hypothetical protein